MTKRFYVIEDDPGMAQILVNVIQQHGLGVCVGTAGDGIQGEEDVLLLYPDIVLIDLLLPLQDGLETLAHLRMKGYNGALVMVSRVTNKEMVEKAYEAGVNFFIHKPINATEVEYVIRQVICNQSMQQALQSIESSLLPVIRTNPGGSKHPAPEGTGTRIIQDGQREDGQPKGNVEEVTRKLLVDLGVVGEVGAEDLLAIALLPSARQCSAGGLLELQWLYEELAQHHGRSLPADWSRARSFEPKAIEQRLRRTISAALRHIASLGLEDYGDPRFERMAGTFFEFEEVRREMNWLKTGHGAPGRFSVKRFVEALLWNTQNS